MSLDDSTKATLESKLKAIKEFIRFVIFDAEGNVVLSSFGTENVVEHTKKITTIYEDNDKAFEEGISIGEHHFDVHRFQENLVWGRRGDGGPEGEGVAVQKITTASGKVLFTLIIFGFPTLSALAVPLLQKFTQDNLASL
eukprot:TRINITY_DN9296_c0_g1_i2.p1 TRINITY_DN9296_c0_g1~~TRINITY_DN9296_c0_g1_i2.p1  ORF type:complete len:140 (+),score=40.71 TRINITY_DN9296_c0_g1_i2:182-601(+)